VHCGSRELEDGAMARMAQGDCCVIEDGRQLRLDSRAKEVEG